MSVSAWRLRDFVEADLPALADLWVAAWQATDMAIDFESRRPWLDGHLRALLAEGATILVGLDAVDRAVDVKGKLLVHGAGNLRERDGYEGWSAPCRCVPMPLHPLGWRLFPNRRVGNTVGREIPY